MIPRLRLKKCFLALGSSSAVVLTMVTLLNVAPRDILRYSRISVAGQERLIGGTWQKDKKCVPEQAGPSSLCNKPDTHCSDSTTWCNEQPGREGLMCGDEKDYQGPTRCGSDSTLYCQDDSQEQGWGTVLCYKYKYCLCGRVDPQQQSPLECKVTGTIWGEFPVPKCDVRTSPPET